MSKPAPGATEGGARLGRLPAASVAGPECERAEQDADLQADRR